MGAAKEKEKECLAPLNDLKTCFPGFGEGDIEDLCSYLECRHIPSGEIVLKQGGAADFMGFLVKGKMVVKKETQFPGKHIVLAILEDGSMFGEIALASVIARSASVSSVKDSTVLILTHDNADRFFDDNPKLGVKLMRNILGVVGLRLQRSSIRLAELL